MTEWLTAQELADWLKVPIATVYTWNTHGDSPPRYRFGRHVRYRRAEVNAWIEANRERGVGRVG